jgi:hypothetical protein
LEQFDPATGLDLTSAARKGTELAGSYASAKPFPHVVIDEFLPNTVLELCLRDFPSQTGIVGVSFDREQERLKTQFNPDTLSSEVRALFYAFNSRPFIQVLENITGIKGLIPDPFFLGAGLHETTQGGYLHIHADFNHHKPLNLERRINVLIYLNKDWQPDYGGQFELWDQAMTSKQVAAAPLFNRCVIFNTNSDSFHGNPEPVNHPRGEPRRSIALYYYTSTWSDAKAEHTTRFRTRAGTGDRVDWSVRRRELIRDLLPPRLYRALSRRR